MMLFFPTSCLSNEVLISGLQLSSQQGEDEVRRSWEKWRAREQCGGNNAHLCSSGQSGLYATPRKNNLPWNTWWWCSAEGSPLLQGRRWVQSESVWSKYAWNAFPCSQKGREKLKSRLERSHLPFGGFGYPFPALTARPGLRLPTQTPCCMSKIRSSGVGLDQATSTCSFTWGELSEKGPRVSPLRTGLAHILQAGPASSIKTNE